MSSRSQKLLSMAKNHNFTTSNLPKQMHDEVFVSNTTKLLKNIQTDISKAVNSNTPVISNNLQTEDNLEGLYYFTDNTVFYIGKYKYNLFL